MLAKDQLLRWTTEISLSQKPAGKQRVAEVQGEGILGIIHLIHEI